jgi:hypothetical protein
MKIDWKKEISLPKLRRPSLPSRGSKSTLNGALPKPRRATPRLSRPNLSRPSLGGPDLQVPKFATDLYADLRDRHLLPLVALLIVAIVAAPILLSSGGGEETPEITPASVEGETKVAGLTVVPAEDGLLKYKRRLGHRAALNPFRRLPEASTGAASSSGKSSSAGTGSGSEGGSESSSSAESASSSSSSGQEVSATTVGGVTTETVEPSGSSEHHPKHNKSSKTESSGSESTESGESAAAEAGEPSTTTETTEPSKSAESTHTDSPNGGTAPSSTSTATAAVVGYTIDAEAGFVPKTSERTGIQPMTKLPNKKHPLVLYLGLSKNHKRALFLMTSNVTAYYGGHCALDKQACQLVEVAPGKGVTFAAGYGSTRYKVHLKRIVPVVRHGH